MCVSIGLTINRQVAVGIIYIPELDHMYTATKGGGAFLNGKTINVSGQEGIVKRLHSVLYPIHLTQCSDISA